MKKQVVEGYRLSAQQRRLWKLLQASSAYRLQCAIRLEGKLDKLRLRDALTLVVRRHEILCTTFQCLPGMDLPIQVISETPDLHWQEIDLTGCGGDQLEQRIELETRRARNDEFDYEQGPLVRFSLLEISSEDRILVVTLPPISGDIWTLRNLEKEIRIAYAAEVGDSEEIVQYVQYSEWQNELLAGEGAEAGKAFWQMLTDEPARPLSLPLEATDCVDLIYHPQVFRAGVSEELSARLRAAASAEGVAEDVFLLGAWETLLWRLSRQSDFSIAIMHHGRGYEEMREAVGAYSKWLPLRFHLEEEFTFNEVLGQAADSALAAYEWHEYYAPLDDEYDENRMEHSSLRTIGFHYDLWPESHSISGVRFSLHGLYSCTDRFKLTMSAWRRDHQLIFELQFNPEFYTPGAVAFLAEEFQTLLEAVAANPRISIGELEVLGQKERDRVLLEFNGTERQYPSNSLIHQLIEAQAEAAPDAPAVEYEGQTITFSELNRRANQLARYLRHRGVGPEKVVGILQDRGVDMIVSVLGVWKSGGAYVAMDTAQPVQRMRDLLGDAAPEVVISNAGRAASLADTDVEFIEIDRQWAEIGVASVDPLAVGVNGENLAYMIYTSGSTGRPKAVMIEHRSVVNLLWALEERLYEPETERLRVSLNAPLVFDASVKQLIQLGRGRTLVVVPEEIRPDAGEMLRHIEEKAIDVLDCTPSQIKLMKEAASGELTGLRKVLVGGEAIDPPTWEWMAEEASTDYWNVYGPSECTVDATADRVDESASVSIGAGIGNVQIYFVDRRCRPVPLGATGEIGIAGAGVGRGYRNSPEKTAERFVPNPFSHSAGARLYLSGDTGRWTEYGKIEYFGRLDHQVKLRGNRIELGEIESILKEHPGVKDAVVILRDDPARLVAYVVAKAVAQGGTSGIDAPQLTDGSPPGGEFEASEPGLREWLRKLLPAYMMPGALVIVEQFRLTRNGKIDRGALPAPEDLRLAEEAEVAQAGTPYEEILAGMWEEVLGVTRVGADSNFFDLGGHSLLATQLMSRVRETFKVEIALRELFEEQTVRGLARKIEEKKKIGVGLTIRPIERNNHDGDLPLSFSQQRLWFLDQLEPGNPFYNCPAAVKLEGRLDEQALALTLRELVRRHEPLRTRFKAQDGRPVQIVDPEVNLEVNVVDLRALGVEERELETRRLTNQEARLPFDLETGPLVRTRLLKLAEEEHVLLYTMHHIVSDGWSMGVLMREFGALYAAFVDGKPSPLPEPAVQYSDYALWQQEWMQGEVFSRQMAYWKDQLAGVAPLLQMQTDYPRPAVQRYTGGRVKFEISRELTLRLKELSRAERSSLFMVMLAALRIQLLRYSGQPDLAVGTPIAGRNRQEIEGSIGFFVNTLVLRNRVVEDQSYRDLLRREREAVLGAYANQELPFEKLVEELEPARSLSHNPLFQVLLSMQNMPRQKVELGSLTVSGVEKETGVAKFDLTLGLTEDDGRLRAVFAYDKDLYQESTVRRMADHYNRLLESIVATPDESISRLEMLTRNEKEQLLKEWNASAREYPREKGLHQLIEEQARVNGDAVAVEYEGEFLTYHEFNRRANQLAHFLRKQGVGPEVTVGLCVERSPALMIGLLGTMKSGGAYMPLDPSNPKRRLAFMLSDAKAPVLLTQEKYLQEMPAHDALVICLDRDRRLIAGESEDDPLCLTTGDNLVYVIYTSGSTGKPKGSMIHHRGLVNYLTWSCEAYDVADCDGSMVHSSISFDLTVTTLYGPLVKGRKVILVNEQNGVEGLGEAIRREGGGSSFITLTPSHLELLSQQIDAEQASRLTGPLVVGGENMKGQLIRFWQENAPKTRIINEYGPTETVVASCAYETESEGRWTGTVPIGRPIANTTLYILDGRLEPTPIGVPGELYIGGDAVSRGYLDHPMLTAKSFLPDPFDSRGGARLYRTGDVARYLESGNIECLGRIDNQVKLRGFRIELSEIENELNGHPAVRESVVVIRDAAQKQLVGYVVLREKGQAKQYELKAYLSERLPEHMIPVWIEETDELPLTANGKVDRDALPEVDLKRSGMGFVQARNMVEEMVAGIWAEVLGLDCVSVEENFFNLGGHSLLATQVISRVREAFGVDIRLSRIFEHPTVSGFSLAIEHDLRRGKNATIGPIGRADRREPLPLSSAQRRLWFINQLIPSSSAYNIPAAVRLEGALDIDALRRALSEIIRRHEVLRTRFDQVNGEPVQIVENAESIDIPLTDLSGLEQEQREERVKRLADAETRMAFDLRSGPLLRASLIRMAEDDHVFLFTVHHIVSDGWSTGILVKEMATLYNAFSAGKTSPLGDLPIQYGDYAVWQTEHLRRSVLEEQLAYWKDRLQASPAILELPTDRPRPAVQTYRGGRVKLGFSRELAEQLKRFSRSERSSLFMTLLTALKVLLSRYSGQEDISVGTPIAGRTRREVEDLVGFFVNTLVIRSQVDGQATFRDLLKRERELVLEAYAHQDLPFEKLVEELRPQRNTSHSPLFQVMMVMQNTPRSSLEMKGLKANSVGLESRTAKFDLTISLSEADGKLSGSIGYNLDLFDEGRIKRMAEHYVRLLELIVADPDRELWTLDMLHENERSRILESWNATQSDYERASSIHDLLDEQAMLRGDAVALDCEGEQLTYDELNRRANQLAHYLAVKGVGPEVVVGICIPRSADLIVAIIAILKAGGAYLPLDPSYPKERLAFMLEDSAARLIICESTLFDSLPERRGMVICIDCESEAIATHSNEPPAVDVDADNLAYVIYTSGSTGKPKGVSVVHRGVVRLVRSTNYADLNPAETILQLAPISFDASTFEIWGSLLNGGRLVLMPAGASSLEALGTVIQRAGVTSLWLTAALFQQMAELNIEGLSGLRQLLAGGDVLPVEQVRKVSRYLPECRLINGYGPTENTTFTCCHTIHGNSELNGSIPIGVPVANSRAYLLDQHFRPVPVGVRGELYAAGDGLARDYLNRPELTAEKFVPNPFGQPGERAYRTGDIASYRANGQIEFMGRRDDQLKVRGFRIEPGEIEAVVGSHPAVREVVVLAREDSTGQKQLVCYAVLDSSIGAGTGDWRAFLKQRLPDYMIPSWFEIIEQLPVTPNGKVDRKALLELRAMRHAEGLVHPRTPVEEIIASMWKEVLKLEGDVGVDDDFFELGGHSLLATQVVSRLRAIFYVDIPLRDLFQTPTIAALAELIEKAKDARPSAGISPISRLDRNAYRIKTSPPAPQAPADRV